MSMRVADNGTIRAAMKGYCRVVANVEDWSRDALVETINGINTDDSFFVGGLAGEPSFSRSNELIDFTENIYGANGPYKGAWNIQSSTATINATIMKLNLQNLKIIFPDYEDGGTWASADAVAASLTAGTGNSSLDVTADNPGTDGNSITLELVDPGTSGPLSVAVSGNAITVTLADDGTAITSTASDVIGAINANTDSSALVTASLADGSDGSGAVSALAATNLSGGAGTSDGRIVNLSQDVKEEAYFANFALCFEGETDDEVGMVIRINNVTNRSDDQEFSPDGDGNVSGVEVALQGHQDLGELSTTGDAKPAVSFYIPDFMATA